MPSWNYRISAKGKSSAPKKSPARQKVNNVPASSYTFAKDILDQNGRTIGRIENANVLLITNSDILADQRNIDHICMKHNAEYIGDGRFKSMMPGGFESYLNNKGPIEQTLQEMSKLLMKSPVIKDYSLDLRRGFDKPPDPFESNLPDRFNKEKKLKINLPGIQEEVPEELQETKTSSRKTSTRRR